MKLIYIPFQFLWRIYFLLLFAVIFIIHYPIFVFLLASRKRYGMAFKLKRFVAIMSVKLSGLRIKINKDADLTLNKTVVVCPNHTSYLDIALIYCFFPNYFVFMGKHQLRKVPLFGIFFKDQDIGVDRRSKLKAHKAFLRAGGELDKGCSVVMFPEGTISTKAPELKPFKNGPFKLAIEKQVPILPITFVNNFRLFPSKMRMNRIGFPGQAIVAVHQPISTAGMSEDNLISLRQKVYNQIEGSIKNYYEG